MTQELTIHKNNLRSIGATFQEMAKPHNAVTLEAEIAYACMALKANDFLAKIAKSNPASMQSAVLNVAGVGISLNPIEKHAYLVPRSIAGDMSICLDVSYMGLTYLAVKSGSVVWAHAEVVRENDDFIVTSIGDKPVHKYKAFGGERGNIVGVYCVAKLHDGSYLTRTMEKPEIDSIKMRSEAGKKNTGPWKTDYEEMAKKTVIKRAAKTWPRAGARLQKAIDVVNHHEGINFAEESGKLPPADVIDYEEREVQIEKVRGILTSLSVNMKPPAKIALLKKHTGFTSFEDVKIQGNKELDKMILSLTTAKTADVVEENNKLPFVPENMKEEDAPPKDLKTIEAELVKEEEPAVKEKPRSAKDVTFTIK